MDLLPNGLTATLRKHLTELLDDVAYCTSRSAGFYPARRYT